jgi:hypothetical protein
MKPWLIIIFLLAMAGTHYMVGKWQRADGYNEASNKFLERDNTALRLANEKIVLLETKLREAEAAKQNIVNNAVKEQEKQRDEIKNNTEKRIAELRARLLRMRDPGTSKPADSLKAAAVTGDTRGTCNASGPTELSTEASEFLLALTGEADEVVSRLQLCQRVLVADRTPTPELDKLATPN